MEVHHHSDRTDEALVQIVPITPNTPLERNIRKYEASVRKDSESVVEAAEAKSDA